MNIQNIIEESTNFIKEWHQSPFLWETEADIQAELYGRLKILLLDNDEFSQNVHYPQYGHIDCTSLTCGYRVFLPNGEYCFPDLIICNKLKDPNHPPDEIEYANWPILCAFELKYITEEGINNPQNNKWDSDKLEVLIENKDIEYGLIINIKRTKKGSKGKVEKKTLMNGRLIIFQVY